MRTESVDFVLLNVFADVVLVHFPRKDRWTSQLQCGHMGVVGRRFMGNS